MGRNLDSKCAQCRRVGEKLFLKGERCNTPKCAMVKRNYPPGFHGPTRGRRKISDYGTQLMEKQKAKKYYNMMEKQFRLTFEKASNKSGDAGKNFLRLLEMRLDNVVFRLGMATSRNQARQLVNHGHFAINGTKTDIPSFIVKPGQEISVRASSKKNPYFKQVAENLKKAELPAWLNLQKGEMTAKVLHEPADTDLPSNLNVQMIIEYYSK
ncbi:30S ribosomal protein S4 [Patescibacteria group bacterium]|nr:30S ribosomal protein S4 [Patescibacteria group bacterium]